MNGGGRREEIFRDDEGRQGFLTTLGEACAKKGKMEFNCLCGGMVSLTEPKERIHFQSAVEAMERSAEGQRDFDALVMLATAPL